MSPALAGTLAQARAAAAAGHPAAAYEALLTTLDLAAAPHAGTEALLAFLLRHVPKTRHTEVDGIWLRALHEVWARPADLALPVARYLALTPALAAALAAEVLPLELLQALETDALFHALLRCTLIPIPAWERLLVSLAAQVLAAGPCNALPQLTETLALWAWLSERLALPAASKTPPQGDLAYAALAAPIVPEEWLAASPPPGECATRLLHDALIERGLRAQWPPAPTRDGRLAAQYEAAPYPRWLREPLGLKLTLPPAVARRWATTAFRQPRVLIAGCGTGQQLFVAHDRYPDASLTALDLSRASLAYAQRQCAAAAVPVAAWHCADLLDFESERGPFAVAECIGVLHHLPEPLEGLKALARLVRSGGLLHAAVYSRRARRTVTALRARLSAEGHDLASLDVQALRRRYLAGDFGVPEPAILHSIDFYSTSGCRDLLLNARERVYDLPEFAAEASAAGFDWLALDAPAAVAAAAGRHFGQAAAKLRPSHWDAFEALQPQSFGGMFDVWFLRR